jgi:hypothetical protein
MASETQACYGNCLNHKTGFLFNMEVQKMAWDSVREKKGEAKKTTASKVAELHPPGRGPSEETVGGGKSRDESARDKDKDLASGMEILELDFLLSIIENTDSEDRNDVTMRKLNFNELLRREQLDTIDSKALKVYARNDGNLYGKIIQCESMKELTKRTVQKSKHGG